MKVKLALLVAALQVLVLAFMAGQREWISRTGTQIVLRTAPVDPNDPMRGAYVRLDYEISYAPVALCRGETVKWTKTTDYREMQGMRDRVVYAAVAVNPHGIAELTSLSDTPPDNNLYIKGRVQSVSSDGIQVRYGIEALFMSKKAALRTEAMALNEKVGAPMNVRVAVGSSGISVLKDFTWEPLGITIALDRAPRRENNDPQRWQPQPTTGLTVTLHNYGDKDVAIVSLPDALSFRMVPNTRFAGTHYTWAGEKSTDQPTPTANDILILKPGTKHAVHIDLTQPRWWIIDTRKPGSDPIPLQKVTEGWAASFRIEYAPPTADAVRGLPSADLIRHAPLRSRAFNANQGVD